MMQQKSGPKVKNFRRLLRKLEREFNSQLREKVECCGVTVIQCHTLLEIEERVETSMRDIAEFFRIDKSTISRTIDILVKKGFVNREINQNNRRYMNLKLTAEGNKLCDSINTVCDRFYTDLMSVVSVGKFEQLFESFSLFIEMLKKVDSGMGNAKNSCECGKPLRGG